MPKKARIETTATGKKFKVVNPNAAGIDIASSLVVKYIAF